MTVHLYKCYWPDHVVTIWTQYLAILFPESQEPVFTQQKTRTSKDYLEAKELVVLLFDLSLILFYKKKKKNEVLDPRSQWQSSHKAGVPSSCWLHGSI